MFRSFLTVAFGSAVVLSAAAMVLAEDTVRRNEQGIRAASCTGNTCPVTTSASGGQCASAGSCTSCTDVTLAATDSSICTGDQCNGSAHCHCAAFVTTAQNESGRGTGCPCAAATAGAEGSSHHVATLHSRLVQEITKNAALTTQLQVHAELARAREEFAQRLLEKEIERAHLEAELRLAHERIQMSEKVVGAVAENARLKASVELTHDRYELLKRVVAQENSHGAKDLAAALAESKAENAKLLERIVGLEKHLETLRVRLAKKAAEGQVK